MRILIDADGCPVTRLTLKIAEEYKIKCILFCDTAHIFDYSDIETVTVSTGADSADFALVNRAEPEDIVVTQDYGLAALCLAKRSRPITQNGLIITDENISGLLESRNIAKKIRRSGGRLKGPPKRTRSQDEDFKSSLIKLIENS
ncbi:MAG: YaiI/YqxD family protein [Clostridiales bacterium]|nr:YaiI/YqxD family protein [Clostridiales bacterium]